MNARKHIWSKTDFESQIKEMLLCSDLLQLEAKHGNRVELIEKYEKARGIAPDLIKLTENFISTYEKIMSSQSGSFLEKQGETFSIRPYYYDKLGYDWVNNGYNASQKDFITICNAIHQISRQSNIHVEEDEIPRINYISLKHLAKGASMAFFVAFLKSQLREIIHSIESRTQYSSAIINEDKHIGQVKSKLNFTKDKLRPIILELAGNSADTKPSFYLDELLQQVRAFNDKSFEFDFFKSVHELCQENANKFWSGYHKRDITEWLKKSPYPAFQTNPEGSFDLFETTWENNLQNNNNKPSDSINYIKPELHNLFINVENKISSKIDNWKRNNDKIGCAAFCDALFTKKWFKDVSPESATVNNEIVRSFSLARYGLDITNQLLAAKKNERETSREKLIKSSIW